MVIRTTALGRDCPFPNLPHVAVTEQAPKYSSTAFFSVLAATAMLTVWQLIFLRGTISGTEAHEKPGISQHGSR